MSFLNSFERWFKTFLPTPFSIALCLTFIAFLLAISLTKPNNLSAFHYSLKIIEYWENGLWNNALMVFAVQMMLILVLGHILALSKPIDKLIKNITSYCNTTSSSATIVCFFTLIVSFFNWGLGLIFGAILARKVAENSTKKDLNISYPIVGAAGYSGLMVWHGGISGSAPIKVAENGHIKELMQTITSPEKLALLPDAIYFNETVFSSMNIVTSLLLLLLIPCFFYIIGKNKHSNHIVNTIPVNTKKPTPIGAEKIDNSRYFSLISGTIILSYAIYKAFIKPDYFSLSFITPNYICLVLLGLCLALHENILSFLKALDSAIGGASGILIQFPLYFGIMGIMRESGLILIFSDFLISISNQTTFPIFTFISAGVVNIFVPSGGGQWAIQGPIIIESAQQLNIPLSKAIMSLVYGDQLTNMLQPFWALPLLGITGLKAKEILPYTMLTMLIGMIIFITALLFF